MTTKRTPAHKRVFRAEKGRNEWKLKAVERREESERWKATAQRKSGQIEELKDQKIDLERKLEIERQATQRLKKELEEQKKSL